MKLGSETSKAVASALQSILDLRPLYPVTHLRLLRHLEWEGMNERAALQTISRMANAGSIIVCGPLDDPHPDTPILPNHLRVGDPDRIVAALLGVPNEKCATEAGGELWIYVLFTPTPEVPTDGPRANHCAGSNVAKPSRRPAGPPRRLLHNQSLVREVELDRRRTVVRDALVARTT